MDIDSQYDFSSQVDGLTRKFVVGNPEALEVIINNKILSEGIDYELAFDANQHKMIIFNNPPLIGQSLIVRFGRPVL